MADQPEPNSFLTTVVFADVAGSSRLYKELGDDEANARISQLVAEMEHITRDLGGTVVKTIGDEIMAHFPRAEDACEATVRFQRLGTLALRIGLDYGRVIEKDADIFGKAVNDAAAVVKIARGRQIIVTEQVLEQIPPDNQLQFAYYDTARLKGDEKMTRLHRIDWEQGGSRMTQSVQATVIMAADSEQQTSLTITLPGGDEMTLTREDLPVHLGRDHRQCRIAVDSSLVSRDHCHLDYQSGKFVLVDHSTNGTWVRNNEGRQVFLKREALPLMGEGRLSVGEDFGGSDQAVFLYASHSQTKPPARGNWSIVFGYPS